MLKHEVRLIDPTAEEVAGALSAAAGGANAGHADRLVPDDPAEWRRFARRVGEEPEGWDVWRGGWPDTHPPAASVVLAGWWTDPVGRKHVAARGWCVGRDAAYGFRPADLDRPPLWHVYPEFGFLRHARDGTHLICACGCGAVGTPAALGWVGDRCGPCFDHAQDGGRPPVGVPGVLRGGDLRARASALGAARWAGSLEVRLADPGLGVSARWSDPGGWDLRLTRHPSGEVLRSVPLADHVVSPFDVAVSPDGAVAAVASRQVVLVDLRAWAVVGALPSPAEPWQVTVAGFAPDGSRLFVAGGREAWAYDPADWTRVASGTVRGAFGLDWEDERLGLRHLTVDPAGGAVYLVWDGWVVALDPASLAPRAVLAGQLGPIVCLALSADGERLFTTGLEDGLRVWPVRRLLEGA